jgi:copper resistance protein D
VTDPLVYARAVHFAATIAASGVAFFIVLILDRAARRSADGSRIIKALRTPLGIIAWSSLALSLVSGAAWLVLTAATMSDDPVTPDIVWTALSQTTFGNAWLVRLVFGCGLAAVFVRLSSAKAAKPPWVEATAIALAVAFVGSLAWAGHAIGAEGAEGVLHPAADALHLIAAAAWLGTLLPLALLLGAAANDAAALATMRTATLRFSALGLVSVGTLLATGIVNTWYLVGSIAALLGTDYGRLVVAKIALFLLMVGIAAVNRLRLTPQLIEDGSGAVVERARRQLRRNATIEASLGAAVIAVVAALGVLPPASHSHQHVSALWFPPEAAFQHIHSEQGMADIVIEPGRVGTAAATIRLSNDNDEPLEAREMTLTLTAPTPGSKPVAYPATQDADGNWQVEGITLAAPGNWSVAVDALLSSNTRLQLAAQIVIEAK